MRAETPMPSPRGMYTMSRDGSATKVVEARTLGAHRILDHLDQDVVAFVDQAADILDRFCFDRPACSRDSARRCRRHAGRRCVPGPRR